MASKSDPAVLTADQAFANRLLDHIVGKRYSYYGATVLEGRLFTKLDEQGAPIVRALEKAVCDGALLCERTPAKGVERTIQAIKADQDVIPLDVKVIRTHVTRAGLRQVRNLSTSTMTANRPLQREHVHLFIVYLPESQVYLFLPKKFSDLHVWSERWEEYGNAEVPRRFLPCVVRFEDITEACQAVRACALDQNLPFVNPTTQVQFPAGLFDTVPASLVLSRSKQLASTDQIIFIQSAVSKHTEIHFDFHAIPVVVCDFTIDIPGCGVVRFEAKINCFTIIDNTKLSHLVTRLGFNGRFPRMFRRSMTMQYLFIQSEFDFAYIIPVGEIPDAWYVREDLDGSAAVWSSVPLTSIERFRVDLKSVKWVQDMVRIVQTSWPPSPASRDATDQDFSLLAQHVADEQQLVDIDNDDTDDEGPESVPEEILKGYKLPLHMAAQYLLPPGMFTSVKAGFFESEGRQYQQLMKACASVDAV